MVRIIADSSCDISVEEGKKLGVEIIPLIINFGKESYRDCIDINAKQFYEKLKTSNVFPTTSQPPFNLWREMFEQAKENNDTIILILLSSKISGSYETACLAKSQVGYENIHVIDSRGTIQVEKFLVLEAIKYKDKLEANELVKHINDLRDRIKLRAAVDTLDAFLRGGRIKRSTAVIGTLLNIKPLISFDNDGTLLSYGKKHGLNKALNFIVDETIADGIDNNYPVMFGYCMTDEGMKQLIQKATEKLTIDNYTIEEISPVIGVHVGTNASIIVYVAKEK